MEEPDNKPSGGGDSYRLERGLSNHVAKLPMLEQRTVQLGAGAGIFAARQAHGRDVVMFQTRVSPKLIGHVLMDPAWVAFMLPLVWRGDYILNGLVARPNQVFMTCDPSGYATVGEARDTLAVAIRRSQLIHAMRVLAGGAEVPPPQANCMILEGRLASSLRFRAEAAMNSSLSQPLGKGQYFLLPTIESDIISLFSEAVLSQPDYTTSRDPGRVQPIEIVRAAERAYDARQGQTMSLAQLCEASGAGQTWLSKCFRDVYDVSPVAYLRARRLSEARARLLDRSAPAVSVKNVALSLGFMHLGRFAAEYRTIFEENPSDTLVGRTPG